MRFFFGKWVVSQKRHQKVNINTAVNVKLNAKRKSKNEKKPKKCIITKHKKRK